MAKKKKRAARKKTTSEEAIEVQLPVEWYVPDDIKTYHVTDMMVQYVGNAFVASFYELRPPLFTGSSSERQKQAEKLTSIRKQCVTRVAIGVDRMPEFIKAFQANQKRYQDEVVGKEQK